MGNVAGREEDDDGDEEAPPPLQLPPPLAAELDVGAPPRFSGELRSVSVAPGGSPPGSPGRPLSPRMFVPQAPVLPLKRAAEPTPVFNQILDRQEDFTYDPPEKEIPTLLVWTLGGTDVAVEGSWDNWAARKLLKKSGKDFSILLALPAGVYRYRFIVDGVDRYLPDLPTEENDHGQKVNLLDVTDFIPDNIVSVAEFVPPPSPDSSYSFQMPDDKEFSKEPPALPSQLLQGILGTVSSDETYDKPQHVVLNHLYIEKGWSGLPLVSLGITHRFQAKFVTVILYKPIER